MAPHEDPLAGIAWEGFALLEIFDRGRISTQVPKDQHNVFHDKAYPHAPVFRKENVGNSKKAATKHRAVMVYRDSSVSSNENIINSKEAAETYGGVVITGNPKKSIFTWRF